MTSRQESSKDGAAVGPTCDPEMGIESLAGTFHPHAIEVQDFSYYAQVIDLRPAAEYRGDHIPGAVNVEAPDDQDQAQAGESEIATVLAAREPGMATLWPAIEAVVAGLRLDQAILVYCGRGGLVSTPVARALRWRGWTTDVLPGGWINYRRWVQAGLEVLPRLVPFRSVACTLGSENARVLGALQRASEQVLDLEGLAGWRRFAFSTNEPAQPSQPWFESQLLRELRTFDPRRPVWVADAGSPLGAVSLPGALSDALAIAPVVALDAPAAARVDAWVRDEPMCADTPALVERVSSLHPPPPAALIDRWRQLLSSGAAGVLLASILHDCLDVAYGSDRASRAGRQHALKPLSAETLAEDALLRTAADYVAPTGPPEPAAT
jgi:tRNA 2-selenouridine synthase